jgi:ATP-dependent exoDNAse (exonuclease V) alpha subunit
VSPKASVPEDPNERVGPATGRRGADGTARGIDLDPTPLRQRRRDSVAERPAEVGNTLGGVEAGELDALVSAYAATIHKSQGSEYPAVFIPILTQHYAMLRRNLLYTGVTRGKHLVVLVGQPRAVAIAVKNVSGRRRWSKLDEWLAPQRHERFHSRTS